MKLHVFLTVFYMVILRLFAGGRQCWLVAGWGSNHRAVQCKIENEIVSLKMVPV